MRCFERAYFMYKKHLIQLSRTRSNKYVIKFIFKRNFHLFLLYLFISLSLTHSLIYTHIYTHTVVINVIKLSTPN